MDCRVIIVRFLRRTSGFYGLCPIKPEHAREAYIVRVAVGNQVDFRGKIFIVDSIINDKMLYADKRCSGCRLLARSTTYQIVQKSREKKLHL